MEQVTNMDLMALAHEHIDRSKDTFGTAMEVFPHASESLTNTATVPEEERFSVFGEETCGEPMMAQRVVLNFVPTDEDNEVSKKCCAFWQFVKEHPELNQFMVKAEPIIYSPSSTTTTTDSSSSSSVSSITVEEPAVAEKSAVDMLGFAEEKGLLDRIFEAKLPTRYCAKRLMSREYHETRETAPFALPQGNVKKTNYVCSSDTCEVENSHECPPAPSCPKAVALCTVLEHWDQQHPKSMEQPGHPPCLSHSIMERKIVC